MSAGPFWKLTHSELVALGANAAERSELHGRLGLAALLQVTHEIAPLELGRLVRALSNREHVQDFATVAGLASPLLRGFEAFAQVLTPGARESLETLVSHGDIVAWESAVSGHDPAARKEQARFILAYRNAVPNLREQRIGVVAAARWATDETMRARLERVGGRFGPRMLFDDLLSVGVLAALRFRLQLARVARPLPVPDARAFDASPAKLSVALAELDAQAVGTSIASSAPSATAPRPAVATAPRSAAAGAVAHAPAPSARPVPGPNGGVSIPSEPPGPSLAEQEWLAAAQVWARDRPAKLAQLFEMEVRLRESRLWPQLAQDVARLRSERSKRDHEIARLAFTTLLDEYVRTFPRDYGELLELLTVEHGEIVRAGDVGTLWALLEPLFCGWARRFDPQLDIQDKGKVVRTLSRFGDILPWDDDSKGSKEKRRRQQDAAIDAVYLRGEEEAGVVRRGIFWASTRARNDQVHREPDHLAGRVRPMDLLTDVTALAASATLRFRMRLAEEAKSQASLPSVSGLSAALMAMFRGKAK